MTIPRNLSTLIIGSMLLLTAIGILAIWSVSPEPPAGQSFLASVLGHQAFKQLLFALISLAVFAGLFFVNYYRLKDYAFVFYFIFLGLILILVVWGRVAHGAKRWIPLGPFALQPSEFMKIALVLALARLMMYKNSLVRLRDWLLPAITTFVPIGLVLIQPHLGSALLFFPTFVVMLFAGGARRKHLLMMLLLIALLVPLGYFFLLKDYQRYRLRTFWDPGSAPTTEGFQSIQSRVAVGSGGVIGRGWGASDSTADLFVPERHNDFVFTTISEKWGFLGSSLIIFLYLLMLISAVLLAYNTREPFGRLTIVGLVTYLTIQTFINIGMTVGLAPISGLPLPFVSYGGSSLLSSYIAVALILNIGTRQLPSFAGRDFE